ncbi:MAG: hypothetical protein JXB88_23610 [Spirochaetales bacterium]|nr:hypothetical protein [Spirochaetales bacterium]
MRNIGIDKIHFAVGVDYFNQEQYDIAYYEFSMAYALNPMYLSALNNLAVLVYFSGDMEMSYAMLKHVYQLNPKYKTGVINFWLYNKLNKNKKEEKKLEDELDDMKVEYHNIQNFIIELDK